MRTLKSILSVILFICFVLSATAQVGINTEEPTATLDINGDLRVRTAEISNSTEDYNLVIDAEGVVKRSLISNSLFRGYLASDFEASADVQISKINNFTVIEELNDDFDEVNSFFIPSVTGLYNIVMTVTSSMMASINETNVVYGLVDNTTNKWIMRFSIPKGFIESVGINSKAGATNSFSGAVMLTKGKKYYFGVTYPIRILSNPSGNTGQGIGTYFSIELIKAY